MSDPTAVISPVNVREITLRSAPAGALDPVMVFDVVRRNAPVAVMAPVSSRATILVFVSTPVAVIEPAGFLLVDRVRTELGVVDPVAAFPV